MYAGEFITARERTGYTSHHSPTPYDLPCFLNHLQIMLQHLIFGEGRLHLVEVLHHHIGHRWLPSWTVASTEVPKTSSLHWLQRSEFPAYRWIAAGDGVRRKWCSPKAWECDSTRSFASVSDRTVPSRVGTDSTLHTPHLSHIILFSPEGIDRRVLRGHVHVKTTQHDSLPALLQSIHAQLLHSQNVLHEILVCLEGKTHDRPRIHFISHVHHFLNVPRISGIPNPLLDSLVVSLLSNEHVLVQKSVHGFHSQIKQIGSVFEVAFPRI